jgi:hypothetical protein
MLCDKKGVVIPRLAQRAEGPLTRSAVTKQTPTSFATPIYGHRASELR